MVLNWILIVSVCTVALALVAVVVTWSIKCVLEWSDDIAYWWKEFKERHQTTNAINKSLQLFARAFILLQ